MLKFPVAWSEGATGFSYCSLYKLFDVWISVQPGSNTAVYCACHMFTWDSSSDITIQSWLMKVPTHIFLKETSFFKENMCWNLRKPT